MWLLAALIGYLLGSIPFGFLIGKAKGIDIRRFGSGATGGTNVLRTLGVGPAILTGLGDAGKGVLAAYIGFRLAGHPGYALGGFLAVVGHSYPVWLRFKGGKSVATGAGALGLFYPVELLVALGAFLAAVIPTRYVSLGSLVGAAVLTTAVLLRAEHSADKLLALGACAVIYIRHLENIKRLAAGTENKLGQKAKPRVES
jgi:glycerol-3-phosphate acyltransferase PlsY